MSYFPAKLISVKNLWTLDISTKFLLVKGLATSILTGYPPLEKSGKRCKGLVLKLFEKIVNKTDIKSRWNKVVFTIVLTI